jgi:glycosyltransferase involved in cell wall biosynthesis
MRVLIVSFSTYTSHENRRKLDSVAERVGGLSVIAGDASTMWDDGDGAASSSNSHPYEIRVLPSRFRWWQTRFLVGFRRAAVQARPEIVHIEAEPWQMLAQQAVVYARRRGIPVGIQFAEDGPRLHGIRGWIRRSVAAFVLRRCNYAIGWTSHSADVARRLAPKIPVFAIPGTGVADWQFDSQEGDGSAEGRRWFGDQPEGTPKLAFAGRLVPDKGVADLIAICDALSEQIDIRVAIAGSGPCEHAVLSWARTRPWVSFHGVLSIADVSRCLRCADVALVPSHLIEQFGKVAVEAMAAGTPVIGYACGALPEVVGDGGVLVAEGDIASLEEEVANYLSLPAAARAAASLRATERASAFANDVLADQLVEVWSGAIRSWRNTRRIRRGSWDSS